MNLTRSNVESRRLGGGHSEHICLLARQNGISAEQARYLLTRLTVEKR
jgi:hypothetical protein